MVPETPNTLEYIHGVDRSLPQLMTDYCSIRISYSCDRYRVARKTRGQPRRQREDNRRREGCNYMSAVSSSIKDISGGSKLRALFEIKKR